MLKLKNYCIGFSLALSGLVFGQGAISTVSYPQMYENQVANSPKTSSTGTLTSSTTDVGTLSPKERIELNISTLMNDPVLRNANWGFVVYDPKTKKVIASHNEDKPLIPASTTKLLTTEAALALLGEKFRWLTQLEHSGEIDENGILQGNLYLIGSGDPSLGTNKAGAGTYSLILSDFIQALKEKGIKKVNGDIIIQTAVFKENKIERLPENIVWLEQKNYFLPVGSTRDVDPKKEKFVVKQTGPATASKKYFYISPYTNKIVYTDEYSGGVLTTKLPDPPAYLANKMRETMVKSGVGITGKVVTKTIEAEPEIRIPIVTFRSPTLNDIMYYTNQRSDNGLAESTLRMVGFQKLGDQTLESGRQVVRDHLAASNFIMDGFNYIDGSGLSRAHSVTPMAQVRFLTSLMDKNYYKPFFDSLPIGGQSGTLKSMFAGSGYGNVFAKTGTLNGVKTLAGYLKTQSGKTLVFSLLINNYSGGVSQVKTKMEQLLEPVLNYN